MSEYNKLIFLKMVINYYLQLVKCFDLYYMVYLLNKILGNYFKDFKMI